MTRKVIVSDLGGRWYLSVEYRRFPEPAGDDDTEQPELYRVHLAGGQPEKPVLDEYRVCRNDHDEMMKGDQAPEY